MKKQSLDGHRILERSLKWSKLGDGTLLKLLATGAFIAAITLIAVEQLLPGKSSSGTTIIICLLLVMTMVLMIPSGIRYSQDLDSSDGGSNE